MRRNDTKKINVPLRLAGVLLLLVVITICVMPTGFYAKYAVSAKGNDNAEVASFNFTAENAGSKTLDLSTIRYPGTEASFEFTVSNGTASNVSEVAQSVKITLTQTGDALPLVFTVEEKDGGGSTKTVASGVATELVQFKAAEPNEKTYVLKVIWPENENDVSLMNKKPTVTLTVTAEQID